MGKKELTKVTLENSILSAYCMAKDVEKYTPTLYPQLVNLFSQHELALYTYFMGIVGLNRQVNILQVMGIGKEDQTESCDVGLESKLTLFRVYTDRYRNK